jgi:signal transduction histidine kinase
MLRQYKSAADDKTLDSDVIQLKELNEIAKELNQAILERQKTAQAVAQSEIARQVAHDIRGPISLIEALIMKLKSHNDSTQEAELLASVAKRIHTIADDLLERHQTPAANTESATTIMETFIPFLKELEKRANLANIQFTADLCHIQSLQDINVNALQLTRTISNLYDNAIQACDGIFDAKIHLSIRQNPICQTLTVTLEDNGHGIPTAILPKLGEKGFTWGKPNGSGLGLYQARQFCEIANGQLTIANRATGGSEIKLIFHLDDRKEMKMSNKNAKQTAS